MLVACEERAVYPQKSPLPVDIDLFGVILRPSTRCEDSVKSILHDNV